MGMPRKDEGNVKTPNKGREMLWEEVKKTIIGRKELHDTLGRRRGKEREEKED